MLSYRSDLQGRRFVCAGVPVQMADLLAGPGRSSTAGHDIHGVSPSVGVIGLVVQDPNTLRNRKRFPGQFLVKSPIEKSCFLVNTSWFWFSLIGGYHKALLVVFKDVPWV